MFQLGTKAFTSYGEHLSKALRGLPEAHRRASAQAAAHVHQSVVGAASEAGWEPEGAIGTVWHEGQHWISIAKDKNGSRVFNKEFGTHKAPPNPVIRTTISSKMAEANTIYGWHLNSELGLF